MEIISNKIRQNENDQTIYFTLTDDEENEYKWHCNCPKGIDIQAYLEGKMQKFYELIQQRIIRDGEFKSTHPAIFHETDQDEINNLLSEAKNFVDNWTYSDINDFVDANFSDHSTPQKNYLKKAGKAILFLLKVKC